MAHTNNICTDPREPRTGRADETARGRLRGHRVFAWAYDRFSGSAERGPLGVSRRGLVRQAHGVTLDLGSGTGHNLPHFTDEVTALHLVEPDPHMLRRLRQRVTADAVTHAVVHQAGAEQLPFPDASVDTVVSTLTLCSVQDPEAAAAELRRVLKPTGQLLVLEHVRSHDARLAGRQDKLNRLWGRLAGGCHLNRDTGAILKAAGFRAQHTRRTLLPGPTITAEAVVGGLQVAAQGA